MHKYTATCVCTLYALVMCSVQVQHIKYMYMYMYIMSAWNNYVCSPTCFTHTGTLPPGAYEQQSRDFAAHKLLLPHIHVTLCICTYTHILVLYMYMYALCMHVKKYVHSVLQEAADATPADTTPIDFCSWNSYADCKD